MRIGKAGWVRQNDACPYLPSAYGLPFVPNGLVEVVVEGFNALDKPGRSAIIAFLSRRTRT